MEVAKKLQQDIQKMQMTLAKHNLKEQDLNRKISEKLNGQ